jgi:hypothetical protein
MTEICHCGKPGMFGYQDRAAWPRRLPTGEENTTTNASLIWFCADHRWGQCYADARVPYETICETIIPFRGV